MTSPPAPYYHRDLARVHHLGFSAHPEACAPGILRLLEPIAARGGLVLEIGCGSGLLTQRLVDGGCHVLATDASPAMLDLARSSTHGVQEIRQLTLPDDPLPSADAIVGTGHALNYLPDADAIDQALRAIVGALRPGGVLAIDLCDLEWGSARQGAPNLGLVDDEWAIVSRFSTPSPDRFVREMTTFTANGDGSWRRDDERHDNVLVDVTQVAATLTALGIATEVRSSFGDEQLPVGLRALVGAQTA